MHYIAPWYRDPIGVRFAELIDAVGRMICVADSASLVGPHRPTFAELVSHGRDGLNVLTNTDCYIHSDDVGMLDQVGDDEAWCLSRTDNIAACSQDVWVWRGRLNVPDATYPPGVLGCDNRFAYDLSRVRRRINNPSRTIRVEHNHASAVRRSGEADRLPLPYLFVEPVELGFASRLELRGDVLPPANVAPLLADLKV